MPDPVFVITGASTGIGAATARAAAEAGHRVVLAARSEDSLAALAAELGGDERAIAVRCDVTEWADNERLAQAALDTFGRIDVVFANAGFGAKRGWLEETPERWRAMVLTNVLGAAYTARAAIPALRDSAGHLLLTSSVAGRRPLPGSLYSCTKHAVTAMGEALRQDLDGTGVRVTLIEPGMVDTPFFDSPPSIRALEPEDVARAVMYAVSQPPHVDVNEILIRPTASVDSGSPPACSAGSASSATSVTPRSRRPSPPMAGGSRSSASRRRISPSPPISRRRCGGPGAGSYCCLRAAWRSSGCCSCRAP